MNLLKTSLLTKLILPLLLMVVLFSGLSLHGPKADAQDKGSLCSGANLDLNNTKRSCKTEDGKTVGNGGVVCKDDANNTVGCGDNQLNDLIGQIVNIFSVIVGVVAVIMIIYGGFRYITSGGDSGKIEESKKTLVYAIIGLIIVALAQFIVKFILEKATK